MRPPSFALPSTLGYLGSSNAAAAPAAGPATAATPQTIQEHLTVQAIIRNYQVKNSLMPFHAKSTALFRRAVIWLPA